MNHRGTKKQRNEETMRVYEQSGEKRMLEQKRKFVGMRRYEADKKRSILYLALGAEGKRVFYHNHPRVVKVLPISFEEFFDLLEAAFIKPRYIKFLRTFLGSAAALSKILRDCQQR